MILTEYDEELHAKTLYEEGLSIGVQAFRQSLLQYIGRTLQHWMTLAWDCNSIEELSRQISTPGTPPSQFTPKTAAYSQKIKLHAAVFLII